MPTPCIFFDRDGIINQSPGPGYVERPEDFHLIPAFLEALLIARERGYKAVVITNQRGVGLGIMTEAALTDIHKKLEDALAKEGLKLDAIYYCTATENDDPRRKPNPGMLWEAAEAHDIDLAASWMIGDNEKDVLAGKRAGCRTILVQPNPVDTQATHRVPDMSACAALLSELLSRK